MGWRTECVCVVERRRADTEDVAQLQLLLAMRGPSQSRKIWGLYSYPPPPVTLSLGEVSEKVTRFFGALMILGRVVEAGSDKGSGDWRAGSISNGGSCS